MSGRPAVVQDAAIALIAVTAVAAVAVLGDNYVVRLATTLFLYASLALSWNLIGGYAGYPSFATAAFFGLGAYANGVLQAAGLPFAVAWIGVAGIAAVCGALLGFCILHLRGHYFAIASLVVGDVLREIVNSWTSLTGGGMGMNLPLIAFSADMQARFFMGGFFGLALAAFLVARLIDRRPLGFTLRCIEQNDTAAAMLGADTRFAKSAAFTIACIFAGAAGAIYASWVSYIDPTDVFDVLYSVKPIIMALLGGIGTVTGPVIGAVVFLGLEELFWRNFLETHEGVLGLLVVLLVLFLPDGIHRLLTIGRHRTWRAAAS